MASTITRCWVPSLSHSLPTSTTSCHSYLPPLRPLIPTFSLFPTTILSPARSHSSKSLALTSNTTSAPIRHHLPLCPPTRPSPSPITLSALFSFHTLPPRQRDHHFDTLKLVERLQGEGFTEEQAVAIMNVLSDAIEER